MSQLQRKILFPTAVYFKDIPNAKELNKYLFKEIKNVKALITNIRIDTDLPQFFSNEIDLIVKFIIEEFNE